MGHVFSQCTIGKQKSRSKQSNGNGTKRGLGFCNFHLIEGFFQFFLPLHFHIQGMELWEKNYFGFGTRNSQLNYYFTLWKWDRKIQTFMRKRKKNLYNYWFQESKKIKKLRKPMPWISKRDALSKIIDFCFPNTTQFILLLIAFKSQLIYK